jgi:hypothetical protein
MIRNSQALIYSDSDGVICDFFKGAELALGHPFRNSMRAVDGAAITATKDFWETLPPMPDFQVYWNFIKKYHPHILTAVPSAPWPFDFEEVARGKRAWYHHHIPSLPQQHIHVVYRRDKAQYARSGTIPNILIDDHLQNVQEFEMAGGIGVLHISAKVTILKLKELGYY